MEGKRSTTRRSGDQIWLKQLSSMPTNALVAILSEAKNPSSFTAKD
jgi:hypothetical protein